MSFDSALSPSDSRATFGASADEASGGARLHTTMAKKQKAPTTETANTTPTTETANTTPATNAPQTPGAVHDAAVRKAERAFLAAVDAGGDGTAEREALKAAKSARAAFMANRLPIAARAFVSLLDGTSDDLTTPEAQAAITELRSALSGIAKPATVTPSAPTA